MRQDDAGFAHVAEALAWILLETAFDESANGGRRGRRQRREIWSVADDRREDVRQFAAPEGPAAGQHLVEDAAERPDVRPLVHGLAARLFGRHVGGGAEDDAELGHGDW